MEKIRIDKEELYSRQKLTYGAMANNKLMNMNVLVFGFSGVNFFNIR